jgi:hypothetical protein
VAVGGRRRSEGSGLGCGVASARRVRRVRGGEPMLVSACLLVKVFAPTFGILRPNVTMTDSSSCATLSSSRDTASSGDDGTLVLARYVSSSFLVKRPDMRASSPSLSTSGSYTRMLCMKAPASSISCFLCPMPSIIGSSAEFHHTVKRASPVIAGRSSRKADRKALRFSGPLATCRWYSVWRSSWKRCESWSSMSS